MYEKGVYVYIYNARGCVCVWVHTYTSLDVCLLAAHSLLFVNNLARNGNHEQKSRCVCVCGVSVVCTSGCVCVYVCEHKKTFLDPKL
jgi:hypothetical protein